MFTLVKRNRMAAIVMAITLWMLAAGTPRAHLQAEASCHPSNLRTANWSTNFCQSMVDFDEIIVGNPIKDGIPSVTNPKMETIEEASGWLGERSPVIALALGDEARAYPLAILMWHEIANDEIAGRPVAVTFCPLCNSAVTFDRRLDGAVLDFGVSGMLRHSDLIMYDRQSESWWQQLTGRGLVGEYAGALLDIVPSQVISFDSFAERYPRGLVMSRETGHSRQYGINPYANYDSQPGQPFLFRGKVDPRLSSAVGHVLAATVDDVAVAYPFAILREERVINDTVGDTPVAVFFQGGVATALGDRVIDSARDIGTAGMYESTLNGAVLQFVANADGGFNDLETGSTWSPFGEAIAGELAGSRLNWIDAFPHFWFAWAAFYPDTVLYGHQPPSADTMARNDLEPILGDPAAPVTLIEYGAYGCHACKYWHEEGIIEAILEEFAGEVNFTYRDIPIIVPPYSQMAAEIAQCALDQGNQQFWTMHDVLFTQAEQGRSGAAELIALADQAGLDAAALDNCYRAGTHVGTVRYDHERGAALGIRSTPTFVIGGVPAKNANPAVLRELLQAELAKLES